MALSTGARQTGHAPSESPFLTCAATHVPQRMWPQGTSAVSRPGCRQLGHSAAFAGSAGGGGGANNAGGASGGGGASSGDGALGVPMGATIVPREFLRPDEALGSRGEGLNCVDGADTGVKTGSVLASSRNSP